jgi:hypothetical protein
MAVTDAREGKANVKRDQECNDRLIGYMPDCVGRATELFEPRRRRRINDNGEWPIALSFRPAL